MNDANHLLRPCRRCQTQVSPLADKCLKCGEPEPTAQVTWGGCLGVILLCIPLMYVAYCAALPAK